MIWIIKINTQMFGQTAELRNHDKKYIFAAETQKQILESASTPLCVRPRVAPTKQVQRMRIRVRQPATLRCATADWQVNKQQK
jgi:hypothetical protein